MKFIGDPVFDIKGWLGASSAAAFDQELADDATGPPIVTGTATLTGIGALVAAAMLIIPAGVNAAGTGALAAGALVQVRAAATVAGSGALASSAIVQILGQTAPAGSGILAGGAMLIIPSTATLPGVGLLAAEGVIEGEEAQGEEPSGGWLFLRDPRPPRPPDLIAATAQLHGVAELVASGETVAGKTAPKKRARRARPAQPRAPRVPPGTLRAAQQVSASATLHGEGGFAAAATVEVLAVAELTGRGALAARGWPIGLIAAAASFDGTASLSAAAVVVPAPVGPARAVTDDDDQDDELLFLLEVL